MIVEDFNFEKPQTKEFIGILQALKIDGKKILLLTSANSESVYRSGRNIEKVKVLEAGKASTYDIVNNQVLVLQKRAVDVINKIFQDNKEAVN